MVKLLRTLKNNLNIIKKYSTKSISCLFVVIRQLFLFQKMYSSIMYIVSTFKLILKTSYYNFKIFYKYNTDFNTFDLKELQYSNYENYCIKFKYITLYCN